MMKKICVLSMLVLLLGATAAIKAERDGALVVTSSNAAQSVSIFGQDGDGFAVRQLVSTVSPPVSVAFGHDHLYVLGTTTVESHRLHDATVEAATDGVIALLRADGSAAHVGAVGDQLVIASAANGVAIVWSE